MKPIDNNKLINKQIIRKLREDLFSYLFYCYQIF